VQKRLILFNIIPIIIGHICFLPFWFSKNIAFRTKLTSIEMVFIALSILYLVIINSIYSIKDRQYNFLSNFVLMIATFLLGNLLYYFNWGIATGNLFSPDGETIYLFNLTTKVGFISLLVFGIIWQVLLIFIKRYGPTKVSIRKSSNE